MNEHEFEHVKEIEPVKEIDFEKDVQPCIDSLFTGKYDIIVKTKEEEEVDAPCNISLILRVLLVEFSKLAKTVQKMEKCLCKTCIEKCLCKTCIEKCVCKI